MKKALVLFLASMMILTLGACGEKETESSSSSSSSVSDSSTSEETTEEITEEVTEEEPADDNQGESAAASGTLGEKLLAEFRSQVSADPAMSAQALADAILANEAVMFAGASMPVENGLLMGFANAEITGFKEGVMFSPMIGSIPFVGYIFILEDGSDVEAFKTTLKDNANPAWNICTEADETFIESSGNTVFFLMSPFEIEG